MNRLLIVTPNEQIYRSATEVISEAFIDAKVIKASSDDVVEKVRSYFAGHTGVVVARGNHAHLLKTQLSIPVVDIVLTGQEMAMLLDQACQMVGHPHPKIAFIGFRYMFSDCSPIAHILHADVDIYYAASGKDVPETVERAAQAGIELIIGGEIACECAARLGMKSLFMDSMKESMRNAVRQALHMLEAIKIEQRRTAEFMSLLNYSFDGILKLNAAGCIEVANDHAEKMLHSTAAQLAGQPFLKLPGLQPSPVLEDALTLHKNLYSSVMRIGSESFLTNVASIDIDGRNDGFIVSMQEFGAIDDLEETIRLARKQMGHVAKARFSSYVTHSARMEQLLDDAKQYALYDVPVLISGPSGVEKPRLAECIHNGSIYQQNPFVNIDLNVIPLRTQAEQIFGTDSPGGVRGLISLAQKGTVYFNGVHLLTDESQHQLLNLLLHANYQRVGSLSSVPANVRVICGSYKNLMELAEDGSFLYPLAVELGYNELKIPAVRERLEDIPALLQKYMDRAAAKYRKCPTFTQDAMELLIRYPWPGNLDEMRCFCEKAVILARSTMLDASFLQSRLLPPLPDKPAELPPVYVVSSPEETELRALIRETEGNRQLIAEKLGISRSTLWRRLKKYGLE